jgi:hypothetical protein
MTKTERQLVKNVIGDWYEHSPRRGRDISNADWRELIKLVFLPGLVCPECGADARDFFSNSYDWVPAKPRIGLLDSGDGMYLNGRHFHYQCTNEHWWCPLGITDKHYVDPYTSKVMHD